MKKIDIPLLCEKYISYIDVVIQYIEKILEISNIQNETILEFLLFNVDRLYSTIKQTKTNIYLNNIIDVKNATQKLVLHLTKIVFNLNPTLILKLLPKYLQIQSDSIVIYIFALFEACDNESVLIELSNTHLQLLYKFILNENADIRKSLYNLLIKIDSKKKK